MVAPRQSDTPTSVRRRRAQVLSCAARTGIDSAGGRFGMLLATRFRQRRGSMATTTTAGATSSTGTLTYQLDPAHSSAQFSVRHMMIAQVRGQFSGLSGTLVFDPAKPEVDKVDVTIDASSINT